MPKQQTNKSKNASKGNIYDRILRENAAHIFVALVEWQLGLEIESYQALQENFPKTLEREVDFLYKVTTKKQKELLLHLEFQSHDDTEMLARVQEYHGLIYRKYRLAIQHIVVYLGKGASKMNAKLDASEVFTGFELININEIDADYLLNTDRPEVVILALLSNYKEQSFGKVMRSIIDRLAQLSAGQISSKYISQLLMLSRIHNLQDETHKFLETMPVQYDVYQDTFFLKGMEEGRKSGIEEGRKSGMEEGRKSGMEEGRKSGMEEEKKRAAEREKKAIIRLCELGISAEKIVAAFAIPLERVQKIILDWELKQAKGNTPDKK